MGGSHILYRNQVVFFILGCDAVKFCKKLMTFWDCMSIPSSGVVNERFRQSQNVIKFL